MTDPVTVLHSDDATGRAIGAAIASALGEPSASEAGVVLAVDPPTLARALGTTTARVRIAYVAWLDPAWEETLARADHVLVAHPSMLEGAAALGAPRSRVRAAAFVAPPRAMSRSDARAELALPTDAPVVIVPSSILGDDPSGILLQLSLVRAPTRFLFDVGRDPMLARMLRQRALFEAHMFAEGAISERAWTAADRALVSPASSDLARAVAHDLAPIFPAPSPSARSLARALADLDIASVASSDATLSIAIDDACAPARLERSRNALASLDPHGGAARVVVAMRRALADARTGTSDGLPDGLEVIGRAAGPSAMPRGRPGGGGDGEIERELAALRSKLARE